MTVNRPLSIAGRRQRRRTFITLSALTLFLLAALLYFGAYLRGWLPDSLTPGAFKAQPSAEVAEEIKPPENYEIKINVYNATDRDGLATKTADRLRSQGYGIAMIANDPLKKDVNGVGVVRYGKKGSPFAKIMLKRIKGLTSEVDGRRTGDIDLVLGEKWNLKALGDDVIKADDDTTQR